MVSEAANSTSNVATPRFQATDVDTELVPKVIAPVMLVWSFQLPALLPEASFTSMVHFAD
jgi:hypothetical protein